MRKNSPPPRIEMTSSSRNPKSPIDNWQDRWFLVPIKEILDFEEELAGAKL